MRRAGVQGHVVDVQADIEKGTGCAAPGRSPRCGAAGGAERRDLLDIPAP